MTYTVTSKLDTALAIVAERVRLEKLPLGRDPDQADRDLRDRVDALMSAARAHGWLFPKDDALHVDGRSGVITLRLVHSDTDVGGLEAYECKQNVRHGALLTLKTIAESDALAFFPGRDDYESCAIGIGLIKRLIVTIYELSQSPSYSPLLSLEDWRLMRYCWHAGMFRGARLDVGSIPTLFGIIHSVKFPLATQDRVDTIITRLKERDAQDD